MMPCDLPALTNVPCTVQYGGLQNRTAHDRIERVAECTQNGPKNVSLVWGREEGKGEGTQDLMRPGDLETSIQHTYPLSSAPASWSLLLCTDPSCVCGCHYCTLRIRMWMALASSANCGQIRHSFSLIVIAGSIHPTHNNSQPSLPPQPLTTMCVPLHRHA